MISLVASVSSIEKAVKEEKSNEVVGGHTLAMTSRSSFCVKGLWMHPANPCERKWASSMSFRAVRAMTGSSLFV